MAIFDIFKPVTGGGRVDYLMKAPQPVGERPPGWFDIVNNSGILKAQQSDYQQAVGGPPINAPKSIFWDPYSVSNQLGWRERPTALSFALIESMVWRMPIVQAVIQNRLNQVLAFTRPQKSPFDPGFKIRLRDVEATPTKADKKYIRGLESTIMRSATRDVDPRLKDTFPSLMKKLARDSLMFDQACLEIVEDRRGLPSEWFHVDARAIRLANTGSVSPLDDLEKDYAVMLWNNSIIETYNRRELAIMVRNPRTEMSGYGYGMPEMEMLVNTITSLLWAWQYNQNAFSQGSLQKGLLNITGAMNENQLQAFRHQWFQMAAGVENSWRMPILNAEDIKWVPMQNSNRDMEFSAWMDFLIKVTCAIFGMDPIEVNFKYGTGGGKSMFEGATKSKIVESKDKGLRPLLNSLGDFITQNILWPIDKDFVFEFVGLETMTPKELADLTTQRVRTIFTINELRAERDLAPLKDGRGDIILDANYMNWNRQVQTKLDQEALEKEQEAGLKAKLGALAAVPGLNLTDDEAAAIAETMHGLAQNPDGASTLPVGSVQQPKNLTKPQREGFPGKKPTPKAGPPASLKTDTDGTAGIPKPSTHPTPSARVEKSLDSSGNSVILSIEL